MSDISEGTWGSMMFDCQVCGKKRAVKYTLKFPESRGKMIMEPAEYCSFGVRHTALTYEMTLTKVTNDAGQVLLEREVAP